MLMIRLTFVALLTLAGGKAFGAMQRITDTDTPAHHAAKRFLRGVNLGNSLEYPAGSPTATQTYTTADLDLIRAEGFDHIRLPVGWHIGAGNAPLYTVSATL